MELKYTLPILMVLGEYHCYVVLLKILPMFVQIIIFLSILFVILFLRIILSINSKFPSYVNFKVFYSSFSYNSNLWYIYSQ